MSKQNLLSEVREVMRRLHYSIHTERSYCDWVKRFIHFHHLQARETLYIKPEKKVEDYLSHLAVQANVAVSTQNQAFNALVFLYKQVLKQPLAGVQAARSRREPRIPVVLTREEIKLMPKSLDRQHSKPQRRGREEWSRLMVEYEVGGQLVQHPEPALV